MALTGSSLTYEYHDQLNPVVWEDNKLRPEIKDKLLEIAQAFLDSIELDVDVLDITLTGSLANYNYTRFSDFDLHIITDYSDYGIEKELLKDYFNVKKTIWNTTREITIKGYDVEVYIQDISEKHHSTGVYSIKDDTWVTVPKPVTGLEDIDTELVNKKKQAMLHIIDFALSPDCDVECADKAKEKFMDLRKAALEKGGEFSPENLAFKELRRSGDVERFMKGILGKKDAALSLDSVQLQEIASFKNFVNVAQKRGPRHQSLTAGMNKLGNADPTKSISIVADMHKKKATDTNKEHKHKKQTTVGSKSPISGAEAQQIIQKHNLDINKLRNGEESSLSTGDLKIGFNSLTNMFYLSKYR